MAAAPLRPARFLFLFLPPPLSIGSYQGTEGGGRRRGGPEGRGLDEYPYFAFGGGCDSLETKTRRGNSVLPRPRVPGGEVISTVRGVLSPPLSRPPGRSRARAAREAGGRPGAGLPLACP